MFLPYDFLTTTRYMRYAREFMLYVLSIIGTGKLVEEIRSRKKR